MTCTPPIRIRPSSPGGSGASVTGSTMRKLVPGNGMPTVPGLEPVWIFQLSVSMASGTLTLATGVVSVAP